MTLDNRAAILRAIQNELPMDKPIWLVFLISSVFDVISFGLALGAQSKRNKVDWEFDDSGNYWYCKYSADSASGMAAAAFCLLLIGTLIVMGATRCFCCGIPHMPGAARLCAVLSLVLCWLFFGIAEILLLAGANRNSLRTRTKVVAGTVVPSCELIRSSIFAAAAAFTFLAWILSQLYYIFEVKCHLEGPTMPVTQVTPTPIPTPTPPPPSCIGMASFSPTPYHL